MLDKLISFIRHIMQGRRNENACYNSPMVAVAPHMEPSARAACTSSAQTPQTAGSAEAPQAAKAADSAAST